MQRETIDKRLTLHLEIYNIAQPFRIDKYYLDIWSSFFLSERYKFTCVWRAYYIIMIMREIIIE